MSRIPGVVEAAAEAAEVAAADAVF